MIEISVPDTANSRQNTQIDGTSLIIKFRYLERNKGWEISVFDINGSAIIAGCRIQPDVLLFDRHGFGDRLPDGVFACLKVRATDEVLGRDNFGVGKDYNMFFFSQSELDNA